MSGAGKWGDLGPRVISGVVLAAVGFGLIYVGSYPLLLGLVALGGFGIWELHRLLVGETPIRAGGLAATAILATCVLHLQMPTIHRLARRSWSRSLEPARLHLSRAHRQGTSADEGAPMFQQDHGLHVKRSMR